MTKAPIIFLSPKGKCGLDDNVINQLEHLANDRNLMPTGWSRRVHIIAFVTEKSRPGFDSGTAG